MATINLLSNNARVETPFVKVTIGNFEFGAFDKTQVKDTVNAGYLRTIKYPNYIQSLRVEKINGKVNNYTLTFKYPINQGDDPNFFEKVFSSVAQPRTITFSYGDMSTPSFYYKNEEAIILKVRERLDAKSAVITYTVTAISKGVLSTSGSYSFKQRYAKPSEVIKEILYEPKYGLQELFYGMSDKDLVESSGLIAVDDKMVNIEAKVNISALEYLLYLVECMVSSSTPSSKLRKQSFYSLVVIDDTTGKFNGPYFKVVRIDKLDSMPTAYELDFGYPSSNVITNFEIEDDEGYSIYYNFQEEVTNNADYVQRIDDNGKLIEEYAPVISSNNYYRKTTEAERTWWSKITEFPIRGSITIKGLLRPAILMSYVKLNVIYYGRKHSASGLYAITKQVDEVGFDGFRTTLGLLRVGGDYDYNVV